MNPLFPLPLTTFEKYLWADDHADYPMTFSLVMHFDGEMQHEAFDSALNETIARHPLLSCVIDPAARPAPAWIFRDGLRPAVDWGLLGAPLKLNDGLRIDLTRESGLRIWIRRGDGRTEMTIQSHHCTTDGMGMLRFLGDLLGYYSHHAESDSPKPKMPASDVAQLLRRGEYPFEPPEPISRMQIIRTTLREAFLMFWRRPTPLGAPPHPASDGSVRSISFPGLRSFTFDASQTKTLLNFCRQEGVTLNDLLVRDMFLAVNDWNERFGPGRWLRVNMPVDLRGKVHEGIPSANVMSYTFITRNSGDCRDRRRLLQSIRWETRMIKRWNLGLLFLDGLNATRKIPGLTNFCMSGRIGFATVVHSFLGEISRRFGVRFPHRDGRLLMGNLVFRRLIAAPPIRPKTRAAFVLNVYNGELTVSVRCDPHLFSEEDAQKFLDGLAARLRETAAEFTSNVENI